MALHGLRSITIGVPDVPSTVAYYRDFGLDLSTPGDGRAARLSTVDGGEQLTLVAAARRGLRSITVGVDDPDDLDRAAASLARLGVGVGRAETVLSTAEPRTTGGTRATSCPAGKAWRTSFERRSRTARCRHRTSFPCRRRSSLPKPISW